jgi:hypothetical protein
MSGNIRELCKVADNFDLKEVCDAIESGDNVQYPQLEDSDTIPYPDYPNVRVYKNRKVTIIDPNYGDRYISVGGGDFYRYEFITGGGKGGFGQKAANETLLTPYGFTLKYDSQYSPKKGRATIACSENSATRGPLRMLSLENAKKVLEKATLHREPTDSAVDRSPAADSYNELCKIK